MKKVFFLIFTVLSIISYVFAGLLLGSHFLEKSVGMVMIFLIPLLIIGLLTGVIALYINRVKQLKLQQLLVWLHYFNLILIVLGVLALVYTFLQ